MAKMVFSPAKHQINHPKKELRFAKNRFYFRNLIVYSNILELQLRMNERGMRKV